MNKQDRDELRRLHEAERAAKEAAFGENQRDRRLIEAWFDAQSALLRPMWDAFPKLLNALDEAERKLAEAEALIYVKQVGRSRTVPVTPAARHKFIRHVLWYGKEGPDKRKIFCPWRLPRLTNQETRQG